MVISGDSWSIVVKQQWLPSGKPIKQWKDPPFVIGTLAVSMAIFQQLRKSLPEGNLMNGKHMGFDGNKRDRNEKRWEIDPFFMKQDQNVKQWERNVFF